MSTEEEVPFRRRLEIVIFGTETPGGKLFDLLLLLAITLSVLVVAVESVGYFRHTYGNTLNAVEWVFTVLFTLEYVARLYCSARPLRYAFSFFGLVDLVAILPFYLGLFISGAESLAVVRALRLLRVFRILRLAQFVGEAKQLQSALFESRRKITVFLGAVLALVLTIGTLMYLIEGPANGFSSIPQSMYWAIVTLTTVGYGDVTPATPAGKALASVVMLLGYGMIAVPTGIVTASLASQQQHNPLTGEDAVDCGECGHTEHDGDALYCKRCGSPL